MVLQTPVCGRVGNRRTKTYLRPRTRGVEAFLQFRNNDLSGCEAICFSGWRLRPGEERAVWICGNGFAEVNEELQGFVAEGQGVIFPADAWGLGEFVGEFVT